MLTSPLNVAVVGCGVAGMGAAIALARRGCDVTLFEAFERPQALGSGLLLQPSGLAALRTLGLAEIVIDHGAKINRLDGRDQRGRRILDMSYDHWRPGAFGVGISRSNLFDALSTLKMSKAPE